MAGLSRLNQRHLGLTIRLLELRTSRLFQAFHELLRGPERLTHVRNSGEQGARISGPSRSWCDPVRPVTGRAALFERPRRQ